MKKEVTCLYCGNKFFSYKNTKWGYKKFCNWDCLSKYRKDRTEVKKCNYCNKEFVVTYKNKEKKFCDRVCFVKYQRRTRKIIKCKYCNKEFETKKYNGKSYYQFCNIKCYYEYLKNNSKKYKIVCLHCKKEFYVFPSRKKRKYCSRSCSMYSRHKNKRSFNV